MMSKKIRELLLKKKFVNIILVVFLFLFLFYFSIIRSQASQASQVETIYFYPSVCLGNWQNPTNAQGRPESLDQNPAQLNAENSAVFSSSGDSSREILCGGFTNNISERVDVKKLSLRLIWSSLENQGEEAVPPLSSTSNTEIVSTSKENMLSHESVLPIAENVDTADKVATNVATNVATFIDGGSAESLISSSTETGAPISNSETNSVVDPLIASETGKSLFIIRYTYDGDNWQTLANIKSIDSVTDLELPIRSLRDLPNLRFSIESTGQKKDVYLDGLSLRVDYQSGSQFSEVDENSPDFKNSELISIKSNDDYSLALLRGQSNDYSIWLYNRAEGSIWKKIDTSDGIKSDDPLALKNDYAFWISGDGQSLIGYCISSNTYFSQSIDSDNNDGLIFDVNNFKIKYLNNQFILQDNISGENQSLDDSANFNQEISAKLDFEKNREKSLDENTQVFDVSSVNKDITITVLSTSSTDEINLFKPSENVNTETNSSNNIPIINESAPIPVDITNNNQTENTTKDNIPTEEAQQQMNRLPIINDVRTTDTVPAETVPTDTVPAETVPTETVPTETVPTETVPAGTAPTETVPAGTAPTVPANSVDIVAD